MHLPDNRVQHQAHGKTQGDPEQRAPQRIHAATLHSQVVKRRQQPLIRDAAWQRDCPRRLEANAVTPATPFPDRTSSASAACSRSTMPCTCCASASGATPPAGMARISWSVWLLTSTSRR